MIEELLKKIDLIQELELMYQIDEKSFNENMKIALPSKRTKTQYILDSFMSSEYYLKASFNKDSFVLRLVPDFFIRSYFIEQFKLECKLEEMEEGIKIKAKLSSDSHHSFMIIFIIVMVFMLLMNIAILIEGDFFVLMSIPFFLIFFVCFYFFEKSFLKRLKKTALDLFKKASEM